MLGKARIQFLVSLGVLAVLGGIVLVMNAAPQRNIVVKVKAGFISGYTLEVKDPVGFLVPNKIVNDNPAAYYENVGNNILELMDSSKQGKCLFLSIERPGSP